jgi:hypothetical protein
MRFDGQGDSAEAQQLATLLELLQVLSLYLLYWYK